MLPQISSTSGWTHFTACLGSWGSPQNTFSVPKMLSEIVFLRNRFLPTTGAIVCGKQYYCQANNLQAWFSLTKLHFSLSHFSTKASWFMGCHRFYYVIVQTDQLTNRLGWTLLDTDCAWVSTRVFSIISAVVGLSESNDGFDVQRWFYTCSFCENKNKMVVHVFLICAYVSVDHAYLCSEIVVPDTGSSQDRRTKSNTRALRLFTWTNVGKTHPILPLP